MHSGEAEEVPTETGAEGEAYASDSEVKAATRGTPPLAPRRWCSPNPPRASFARRGRTRTFAIWTAPRARRLGAEVEAALERGVLEEPDAAEARGGIDGGAALRRRKRAFLEDLAPSVVSLH